MSAIANTRSGKVEGTEERGGVVFKGIPYAAPPTGARRWLPPEAPASWSGVREAKSFGPVAPQRSLAVGVLAAMAVDGPQSEDCLYLNVWTPRVDTGRRPVMVWIHGGAFEIGSGSQAIYDGITLSSRGDAVIVTINYRLGPLGFMRLADVTNGKIPSTGLEGSFDQIAALAWVRDNIAEFGGDPGNVTIFGESAGGMSVGTLLGMPAARGLFDKAIAQSGACHSTVTTSKASESAARMVHRMGVTPGDADALRAMSAEAILAVCPTMIAPDPEIDGRPFLPVTDGSNLPKLPIAAVEQGAAKSIAVMVGSTSEEWKIFTLMDPSASQLDEAGLARRLCRRLEARAAARVSEVYRRSRGERGESVSPTDLYSALETDRMFGIPAARLAEAQSGHQSRVYRYLFTRKSPAMGGMLGACHALELGFVFGTLEIPGMSAFCGEGPAVQKFARSLQDAWLAFARSGDPSSNGVGNWPAFDAKQARTMILDDDLRVENAPFENERRAWDGVPDTAFGH